MHNWVLIGQVWTEVDRGGLYGLDKLGWTDVTPGVIFSDENVIGGN